jgi:hypothetical protein
MVCASAGRQKTIAKIPTAIQSFIIASFACGFARVADDQSLCQPGLPGAVFEFILPADTATSAGLHAEGDPATFLRKA